MTNAQWFLFVGGLLLARGLTAPMLLRLPVTPAIVQLAVGLLVGPTVLNLLHFNPLKESALLEVLTEMVVLISLWPTRSMVGWFGVRGIGSLYYLMFAIQHSLPEDLALDLIQLTLIPVTLSILVHGTSVKPLMSWFLRHRSHQSGVNGVKPSQPSETKTVQADK